jgi:hypothetical protein
VHSESEALQPAYKLFQKDRIKKAITTSNSSSTSFDAKVDVATSKAYSSVDWTC